MVIIFNKYGLIATSKQLPIKSVRAIKSLRIDTIKMPQTTPEITIRCLYQKMIMIRHQTISRHTQIPHAHGIFQNLQEQLEIILIKKDIFFPAATVHDMVPGTGVFYAERSGHEKSIAVSN